MSKAFVSMIYGVSMDEKLLRIVCTVGYYVTKTSANSSAVYWSRVSRDNDTALLLAEVLVT